MLVGNVYDWNEFRREFAMAPNLITFGRFSGFFLILWPLVALNKTVWALAVFVLLAATDWLDGYVARRNGLVTKLGKVFDPCADKVLLVGSLSLFGVFGTFPLLWVLFALEMVLFVVGSGKFFQFLIATRKGMEPATKAVKSLGANIFGKSKACAEIMLVALYLLSKLEWNNTSDEVFHFLIGFAIGAAALSIAGHMETQMTVSKEFD